jgi:hypothetical protein
MLSSSLSSGGGRAALGGGVRFSSIMLEDIADCLLSYEKSFFAVMKLSDGGFAGKLNFSLKRFFIFSDDFWWLFYHDRWGLPPAPRPQRHGRTDNPKTCVAVDMAPTTGPLGIVHCGNSPPVSIPRAQAARTRTRFDLGMHRMWCANKAGLVVTWRDWFQHEGIFLERRGRDNPSSSLARGGIVGTVPQRCMALSSVSPNRLNGASRRLPKK